MHVDDGRIYDAEQMRRLREAAGLTEEELAAKFGELVEPIRRDLEELRVGRIVPVSDLVAQKVKLGERELERRAKRRPRARRS